MACDPPPPPPHAFRQVYLTVRWYLFILLGGESLVSVTAKCLAQEHNTMTLTRARTRTFRSGVHGANH